MAQSRAGWVFRAVGVVRAAPGDFGLMALLYLLVRGTFRVLPLESLRGWVLYLLAWTSGFLIELAILAILLAACRKAVGLLRGEGPRLPRDFAQRVARALPYGIGLYFVQDYCLGFVQLGLAALGDRLAGTENSLAVGVAASYLAGLVLAWLVSRYGFTLVGAAVGDGVTLGQSWRMTRRAAGPLLVTTVAWWTLRQGLRDGMILLLPMEWFGFYFDWLLPPLRAVMTVYFAVVAAVWYEKLRPESGEA